MFIIVLKLPSNLFHLAKRDLNFMALLSIRQTYSKCLTYGQMKFYMFASKWHAFNSFLKMSVLHTPMRSNTPKMSFPEITYSGLI